MADLSLKSGQEEIKVSQLAFLGAYGKGWRPKQQLGLGLQLAETCFVLEKASLRSMPVLPHFAFGKGIVTGGVLDSLTLLQHAAGEGAEVAGSPCRSSRQGPSCWPSGPTKSWSPSKPPDVSDAGCL